MKNGVFAILSGLEGRKPFRRVRLCNKKQNILILSLLGAFKCIFNEKMTQKVIFRLKQGRFYFKCHFTIFFVLKIFLAFIFGVFLKKKNGKKWQKMAKFSLDNLQNSKILPTHHFREALEKKITKK